MKQQGDPTKIAPLTLRTPLSRQIHDALRAMPDSGKLSTRQLESVYAIAYSHLSQDKHRQALPAFAFLVQYDPTCRHYLTGLGLCLQHVGLHDDAVHIYSVVIALYPDALEVMFHLVESQLEAGRHAIAREYLTILAQFEGPTHEQDARLVDTARRARAFLALLDSQTRTESKHSGDDHASA